jgi:hypothetical protein
MACHSGAETPEERPKAAFLDFSPFDATFPANSAAATGFKELNHG